VNEAVTDDGSAQDSLKTTDWYPDVPDYIDVAFTTARKAFGDGVKLFYNDYSADEENMKSDRIYALVQGMKQRGVPIDGVGLQMHINGGYSQVDSVKKNMQRFAELGLEVHITELDISYSGWSQESEQEQAQIYAALLQACLDVPQCKSFETWGFSDKYTWKGSDMHPLPFDANFEAKAAVGAMLNVLKGSAPSPSPSPTPRQYETLTSTCQNAEAMSSLISVASVDECQAHCDATSGCLAFDTNGQDCYTKSHCEGQAGSCSGWCGHRVRSTIMV
jgi:endo-1,4-beta-xylanase